MMTAQDRMILLVKLLLLMGCRWKTLLQAMVACTLVPLETLNPTLSTGRWCCPSPPYPVPPMAVATAYIEMWMLHDATILLATRAMESIWLPMAMTMDVPLCTTSWGPTRTMASHMLPKPLLALLTVHRGSFTTLLQITAIIVPLPPTKPFIIYCLMSDLCAIMH